jgi:hypothetical protein
MDDEPSAPAAVLPKPASSQDLTMSDAPALSQFQLASVQHAPSLHVARAAEVDMTDVAHAAEVNMTEAPQPRSTDNLYRDLHVRCSGQCTNGASCSAVAAS